MYIFFLNLAHHEKLVTATYCNTLHHIATHCSLQHTATQCNIATEDRAFYRSYLAHHEKRLDTTHCNTLQHTAIHCNTLQHTTQQNNWIWGGFG